MGNQHSSDDPSLTVSPGGTPHIQAPRSHPNTLSSINASSSGHQMHTQQSPLMGPPPHATATGPVATVPQQPQLNIQSSAAAEQTMLSSTHVSPNNHQPGPESLSDSVRGMLDPTIATPTNANSNAPAFVPPLQPPSKDVFPCAFRWVRGGNDVFVTGSFNAWGGKIAMNRIDEHEWSLVLDVAPGVHQYKYIVDGQWCLDDDAPTALTQDGFLNNVVEVKRPVFEYPNPKDADSDDDDIDERKQRVGYSQRAPSVNDYFNEPPKLPPQLTQIILESPLSSAAQSAHADALSQLLPLPDHVTLNHLYLLPAHDPSLICTGMTQRFKPNSHARITHKFVTTIYYAPKFGTSTSSGNHYDGGHAFIASPTVSSHSPNGQYGELGSGRSPHSARSQPQPVLTQALSFDQYRQLSGGDQAVNSHGGDVDMASSAVTPARHRGYHR